MRTSITAAVTLLLGLVATMPASATVVPTIYDFNGGTFLRCSTATPTIVATGANPVRGTNGNDVIFGTEGSDTIYGLGGNDLLCGFGGNDTLYGGDGLDFLAGGAGDDVVKGGDGDDVLIDSSASEGSQGNDRLDGEAGDDLIMDQVGVNVAHGGQGRDLILVTGKAYGDSGDDPGVMAHPSASGRSDAVAEGGSGSDGDGATVSFDGGNLVFQLGNVYAHRGIANGGSGDDRVFVSGESSAFGGSGSDVVESFISSSDRIDCGSGYDTYETQPGDSVRRCEALAN